jgi:hypothetical protein
MALPKFDWKHIDWKKPSKERSVIILGILAVAGLIYLAFDGGFGERSGPSDELIAAVNQWKKDDPSIAGGSSGGGLTASAFGQGSGSVSNPVPLRPVSGGNCNGFAPEGWSVVATGPQGNELAVAGPNHSGFGQYAVVPYNYQRDVSQMFGVKWLSPEETLEGIIGRYAGEQVQFTADEKFGYYNVVKFSGAQTTGYALWFVNRDQNNPDGYVIAMRLAIGPVGDAHALGIAGAVAASLRCQAFLNIAPRSSGPSSSSRDATHGTGQSSDDDVTMAGTYNAMLGTGYAHDDLGNNYGVDVIKNWNDNGRDGPGIYIENGNGVQKLQNGLAD